MAADREMWRSLPWPFDGNRFPAALGAVIQRTVLDGTMPALVVGHAADGSWYVGDGINDPNLPDAVVATHIRHAIEHDPSIGELATLPPAHAARRASASDQWVVERADLEP